MKPLDPNYLEAFCDWIEDYLLPKFTDRRYQAKHVGLLYEKRVLQVVQGEEDTLECSLRS
jgi:hypothetical protein